MKQLKCENCGATIEITDENKEYATCPYCKAKYQLNERKDIYIRMDDNTKELLTSGFNFFKKTSKIALIPAIAIFIVIIITFVIVFTSILSHSRKTVENTFEKTNKTAETNETENIINTIKDKISKSSFNSTFELRSGTKYKSSIEYVLDDVVTNNKTNKDMLITVIYNDKETADPDAIIDIKHSLDDKKKYEVKLDYDDDGYVNKITIEDI